MSTNKHAIIRYQTLDKCFRNPGRRYYMEDLIEACNKSIYEFTGSDIGIQKRQIFEDIKFMESTQGWAIDLARHKDGRKVFYRYVDTSFSINNRLLNELEENQLKEVLLTLSRFKGMPQFDWIDEMTVRLQSSFSLKNDSRKIIEFEQNQYLKGLEFFSDIFNSILYKKTLAIKYKGFKQTSAINITFHPYYLKEYNNRWFVFGKTDGRNNITNIAIDRILQILEAKVSYNENESENFNEFFEDLIGVSIYCDSTPQNIVIQINKQLWPYIETKPLHGSQKIIKKTNDYILISLQVHINYELTALLLSLGENVKVIEPKSLVKDMKLKAKQILQNYS